MWGFHFAICRWPILFILCASRGPRPLHHSAKVLSVSLCSKWTKVGNSLHTVTLLRQETLSWSLQVSSQERNICWTMAFHAPFLLSSINPSASRRPVVGCLISEGCVLFSSWWSRFVLHCNPFPFAAGDFEYEKFVRLVWPTWSNEHELLPITKRNRLFNWSQSLYNSLEFQYNHLPNSSLPPLI